MPIRRASINVVAAHPRTGKALIVQLMDRHVRRVMQGSEGLVVVF